jgi:hypothetical protein
MVLRNTHRKKATDILVVNLRSTTQLNRETRYRVSISPTRSRLFAQIVAKALLQTPFFCQIHQYCRLESITPCPWYELSIDIQNLAWLAASSCFFCSTPLCLVSPPNSRTRGPCCGAAQVARAERPVPIWMYILLLPSWWCVQPGSCRQAAVNCGNTISTRSPFINAHTRILVSMMCRGILQVS